MNDGIEYASGGGSDAKRRSVQNISISFDE